MATNTSLSTGSSDCPCIDSSQVVSSIANCGKGIISANGTVPKEGFWYYDSNFGTQNTGACYPVTYGSQTCQQHDLHLDPRCLVDYPPSYCTEFWCYVDKEKCKDSSELLFRSEIFPENLGQPFFYSYSTCNSSNSWSDFRSTEVLEGITISVTLPEIWFPAHYKLAADGTNIANITGSEYYDDSIPWRGWVIDYLDAVLEISNIKSFNYTHRSGGSEVAVTSSVYTGAVYDVQTGLSCLAASLFWVTSERLAMTSYTTTVATDKIFLWIENPSSGSGDVRDNLSKVLRPFDQTLWIALFLAVCGVSILSVWFANEKGERRNWWWKLRGEAWNDGTLLERVRIFGRVLLDAFLASTTYFFGHTVEFDVEASLPMKILNFGFGFVILIAVAAYTANLAAFLTISGVGDYLGSMEKVIAAKTRVCGHPALGGDLQNVWPGAEWVFNSENPDLYEGIFENFDAGLCTVIAAGTFNVLNDPIVMGYFCDRGLVSTDSLVLEKQFAFPTCPGLVAGLSYWMAEAEKQQKTIDSFQANVRPPEQCILRIDEEAAFDELLPLTAEDFALPLLVLIVCAVLATILTIRHNNLFSGVSETTDGADVEDKILLEGMNGRVSKGKYEFEKTDHIKATKNDSLELAKSFHGSAAFEVLHRTPFSEMMVVPPKKEITNSQTTLDTMRDLQLYEDDTMRDLQSYQNDIIRDLQSYQHDVMKDLRSYKKKMIEKMIEQEKKEK